MWMWIKHGSAARRLRTLLIGTSLALPALAATVLWNSHQRHMEAQRQVVQQTVQAAQHILHWAHDQVEAGRLDVQAARAQAQARLAQLNPAVRSSASLAPGFLGEAALLLSSTAGLCGFLWWGSRRLDTHAGPDAWLTAHASAGGRGRRAPAAPMTVRAAQSPLQDSVPMDVALEGITTDPPLEEVRRLRAAGAI
ncbi:MAG: hypothetical protein ACK4K3_09355 [Aquabacterium sp.]